MGANTTILDDIIAHKTEEVARRKQGCPTSQLLERQHSAPEQRDFIATLKRQIDLEKPAVIAEIKRASPSKGLIRENLDPVQIAKSYSAGGATCLSVLTDEKYFQGHDDFLIAARAAVDLPVLRKDFVIDSYQILEARALGADCILLIAAAVDRGQLTDLYSCAQEVGCDALIEVHDRRELDTALSLDPPLIGINNRNLRTFETDLDITVNLLAHCPPDTTVVTESGITTREDIASLQAQGVYGFLVGEALMRSSDPGRALRELFF